MGNTHGVPKELALHLRDCLGLKVFIESGTYKAESTRWAADNFECVITIEAWEKHYQGAVQSYSQQYPNIQWVFGDSRTKLWKVIRELTVPPLFWLDAHWVGNSVIAHEQKDECPLEQELDAINDHYLAAEMVILIDDARLFLNPPPYPHDPKQWLTYPQVLAKLNEFPRVVTIKDDVIIAVPLAHLQVLDDFYDGK